MMICPNTNEPCVDSLCRGNGGCAFPETKYLPRGYVGRFEWEQAYDRCDPGDECRMVPCHFVPHKEWQLPAMVEVMSVEEHEDIVHKKNQIIARLEEELGHGV